MLANGTIMLGKFALGIVEAIPGVVSKIPEIVTAIVEEFKENGPEIIQIGKDVVLGIWNGIQSLVGWLNEKIGNFVGGIVDNVKGVLGIHSPSRVFAGIGENMAMGLGAGWENEYGSIKNNITSGLDFGTARVGLAGSGVGQISNGIASGIINSSSAERNIVINLTTTLDGEVLSRKMYDYNEREQLRRGNAFA
jgi:phage-related protein